MDLGRVRSGGVTYSWVFPGSFVIARLGLRRRREWSSVMMGWSIAVGLGDKTARGLDGCMNWYSHRCCEAL